MPLFLLMIPAVALAVVVAVVVRRRGGQHRRQRSMSQRLAAAYPLPGAGEPGHPLQSPPGPAGHIGVSPDGLLVRLDAPASVAHLVPWHHVERVSPGGPGVFVIRLERVGDVMVPSLLGREIWDVMGTRGRTAAGT